MRGQIDSIDPGEVLRCSSLTWRNHIALAALRLATNWSPRIDQIHVSRSLYVYAVSIDVSAIGIGPVRAQDVNH